VVVDVVCNIGHISVIADDLIIVTFLMAVNKECKSFGISTEVAGSGCLLATCAAMLTLAVWSSKTA
jgi:hypothetical protein